MMGIFSRETARKGRFQGIKKQKTRRKERRFPAF
jgi:hypothetical protein